MYLSLIYKHRNTRALPSCLVLASMAGKKSKSHSMILVKREILQEASKEIISFLGLKNFNQFFIGVKIFNT